MKQAGLVIFVLAVCAVGVMSTVANLYTTAMNGTGEYSNEGFEKDGSYYVWTRDFTEPLEGIEWGKFDTVNGKIEISAHEDPSITDAVIHAEIKIKSSWLSGEDAVLEAKKFYEVVIERNQSKLVARGVHPKHQPKNISGAVIHLEVKLPKHFNTEAHSVNGKVSAKQIEGELVLSTVNGEVNTTECPGLKDVHTVNGSIKLQDVASLQKANTVNGSIDARFNTNPTQPIHADAVNGSIKLSFPQDAKYNLEVHTVNGSINYNKDRFSGTQKKREVKGTINGGGVDVKVSTVNGSVSFKDA